MADSMREMAREVLEEGDTRAVVIDILAEFFQDSIKEDPIGVGDWLAQGGTSADLFIEMVEELRSERRK